MQRTHIFCKASFTLKLPRSKFTLDRDGSLVRTAPIDAAVQKAVLRCLQPRLLYHSHSPILAGHRDQRRMYDSMWSQYYWPHVANDFYTTVEDCRECVQNKSSEKPRHSIQLLPASVRLEFIAMDILVPLLKRLNGNWLVLVMKGRCATSRRGLSTSKTIASHTASLFMESWTIPYGIPDHVLTDNGTHFISKYFQLLCLVLGTKRLAATWYPCKSTCKLNNLGLP